VNRACPYFMSQVTGQLLPSITCVASLPRGNKDFTHTNKMTSGMSIQVGVVGVDSVGVPT
jgi:hypothetical protein